MHWRKLRENVNRGLFCSPPLSMVKRGHSIACSATRNTSWVESWCARRCPSSLRVSVQRSIWEDCWWVSTSPWIECHCTRSASPCPRWLEWFPNLQALLRWSSWWKWSHSAIHCGSTRANDSSSCWMRVGDCTWYNRCRCTAQPRRNGSRRHSNTPCHMCMMFHLVVLEFLATKWTHRRRLIISLDFGSVLEG